MATGVRNADEIRREMAHIRAEMHQDVRAVVAGAEAVTDWRRYVRSYPWPSLALAVAAGFLVVPRRRRSLREAAEAAAKSTVEHVETIAPARSRAADAKRAGLFGTLLGLVGPLALRAAQSALGQYVETWIAGQALGPEPTAAPADRSGSAERPGVRRPQGR